MHLGLLTNQYQALTLQQHGGWGWLLSSDMRRQPKNINNKKDSVEKKMLWFLMLNGMCKYVQTH